MPHKEVQDSILHELLAFGILRRDDPRLRVRAASVDLARDDIPSLARRLRHVMHEVLRVHEFRHGFGLAAPQIGISKRAFVFGFQPDQVLFVANPLVIATADEFEMDYEGCLSLWEWRGRVARPLGIKLRYLTEFGSEAYLAESGSRARILFHEIDHLDGALYTDRMAADQQLMSLERYQLMQK